PSPPFTLSVHDALPIYRPLRMGHHAEHIAAFVDDSRDVARGPIRVRLRRHTPEPVAVAEENSALGLELVEDLIGRDVAPLAVRRSEEHTSELQSREKRV